MLEEYLDNLYNATRDIRCNDPVVRRAIIDKVNCASEVVCMSSQDLLVRLDFKPKDKTIEALEAFLAELRSIFWLRDFGFTDIKPLAMGKDKQPDFTSKFGNKMCAIEVFCLTQKHEQQKDSSLGVYKNFDSNFAGSKFGRDFMSKANEKKKQIDSKKVAAEMKILLCVINSSSIINLDTLKEMEQHAELLFKQLKWGDNYYVGLLTGAEINGNITDVVYPKLPM